jgi:phage terminase large subunit-like protein
VANPDSAELWTAPIVHEAVERPQAADRPQPCQITARGLQRDANGVVTAVLETTQRNPQEIDRRPVCAARDYAAHCRVL